MHVWYYIGKWTTDRSGAIAMIFSMALPIVLTVTAAAVDFGMAIRQKSRLQSVVDAAALAAARELSLSNSRTENVDAIVKVLVEEYMKSTHTGVRHPQPTVQTSVETSPLRVEVNAKQDFTSLFGDAFGLQSSALEAMAVAQVIGRPNICVLVLHPSVNGALSLEQKANVTGENCGVYSNSTHNIGIKSKSSAVLTATTICSAGGVQGGGTNFNPPPFLDCPPFEDPLSARPEPEIGDCDPALPTKIVASRRLMPGTYCGGLTITDGAEVDLDAGIYVIKDGPLIVNGGARIAGRGAGFFLSGSKAHVNFEAHSTVELEAPLDGVMAGLLIFASRTTAVGNQHKIYSENAQMMVGTIYVPTGELRIDGSAEIGGKAAYTAIVTETLHLYGGPHIVLNTRYDETDVPVPDGIKGAGQPIQLVK